MNRGILGTMLMIGLSMSATAGAQSSSSQAQAPDTKHHLFWAYIGNTTKDGIGLYKLDTDTGKLTSEGIAAPANFSGFLAVSPNQKFLFVCTKTDTQPAEAVLKSFSIDAKTGKLTAINQEPSGAEEACYVSIDPSGRCALVTHYAAGIVSVIPIAADGKLSPTTVRIKQTGSSIDPTRQTHAYAHSINPSPDGKFAIACDLGADKLFVYKLDADKGMLTPNDPPSVTVPPGSGPRHLTFHPNSKWAYVITEMGATVIGYNYDASKGTLTQMDLVHTLKDGFKDNNTSAEVQIDPTGRFLYASNRIDTNYVTIFSIDQSSGKLTLVGYQDSMGKVPRNFRFDPTGKFLLLANQQSNNLVLYSVNPQTGLLTETGPQMTINAPICVKFVAVAE